MSYKNVVGSSGPRRPREIVQIFDVVELFRSRTWCGLNVVTQLTSLGYSVSPSVHLRYCAKHESGLLSLPNSRCCENVGKFLTSVDHSLGACAGPVLPGKIKVVGLPGYCRVTELSGPLCRSLGLVRLRVKLHAPGLATYRFIPCVFDLATFDTQPRYLHLELTDCSFGDILSHGIDRFQEISRRRRGWLCPCLLSWPVSV